jgi:hypothetical protein
MPKKKLTPEQEKEIKLLRANNEMYERTKEEAKLRGTEQSVRRIEMAQQEVKDKIKSIMDGKIEKIEIPQEELKPVIIEHKPIVDNEDGMKTLFDKNDENSLYGKYENEDSVFAILERHKEEEAQKLKNDKKRGTETTKEEVDYLEYGKEIVNPSETTFNNADANAQYDVISLPSNGECYKNKIGRIPVAYLTAYDENIITSPNLYRDGLVIDYLLKNKIVNKEINVEDLISGDVDAIILFLRATSYGVEFPVAVADPDSGEMIETNVDLSKIKTKEFKLKGDENGYFSYTLPKSKVEVKFKYLTRKEENDLRLLSRLESEGSNTVDLKSANMIISNMLKSDSILDGKDKSQILDSTRKIDEWIKKIEATNTNKFNKSITNRMEMQIVAINGNYDREYIRKAIYNMPASDSLSLRRYILDNEPGLDFEVEIKKPESLGGGSFKTFLEWNDTVFFNIA